MKFAVINNNLVENIIIAESAMFPNWVDITNINPQPGPGWSYNGSVFTEPPAPAPIVYNKITAESFWDRFTNAELVDYDVAMQHDPAASNANKKAAAKLRIFQRETDSTGYRNLTRQKIIDFITTLESPINGVTVLAAGRANTILTTPITAEEAYFKG